MKTLRQLWVIAKFDFFRRVFSYKFLFIALLLFAWILFIIPAIHSSYYVLDLNGYRGFYNSSWISTVIVLLSGEYLSLLLFYVVNDSVQNDSKNKLGPILASSPLSNVVYLSGKFFGNFLVLLAFTFIMLMFVPVVQIIRGETYIFDVVATLTPFLFYLIPTFLFLSVFGLFFDILKPLRGTLGNIIYFIFGYGIIIMLDIPGINGLYQHIYKACSINFSNCSMNKISGLSAADSTTVFTMQGIHLSAEELLQRGIVILFALAFLFFISKIFRRFDPQYEKNTNSSNNLKTEKPEHKDIAMDQLKPLQTTPKFNFFNTLKFEFLNIFKASNKIVLFVAVLLSIFTAFLPTELVQVLTFPLLWLFLIPAISKTPIRDAGSSLYKVTYSTLKPWFTIFASRYVSILSFVLLFSTPLIARYLLIGEYSLVTILFLGIFMLLNFTFIAGYLTGTSKLFEVVFILVWFLGSMFKQVPMLDVLGVTPMHDMTNKIVIYVCLAMTSTLFLYIYTKYRKIYIPV